MISRGFLAGEMLLLFFVLPALFLFSPPRVVTVTLILIALTYAGVISIRSKLLPLSRWKLPRITETEHVGDLQHTAASSVRYAHEIRIVFLRFAVFAAFSVPAVAYWNPNALFGVVRRNPSLWAGILFIYCFFSVAPQTFVYRGFFLERYRPLFSNRRILMAVSAVAFAWAHTIIAHPLVYLLTFAGGLLFASTYLRSRSLLLVSLEHASYGFWLFTVGLGGFFAFPSG